MKKYNAVIIGAGSIGALKDDKFDSPKTENCLTIAHAFYNNPNVNLIGIVDTDLAKAHKAAIKWNTFGTHDIINIKEKIDIIALCIQTKYHSDYLFKVIGAMKELPKIIMAEKPFTSHFNKALYARNFFKIKDVPIAIDYIRRYDPITREFKKELDQNIHGEIYNCKITYTRGLFHEACHAIDLCRYFFGEYIDGKILDLKNNIKDNLPELTVPAFMQFEKCKNVFFCPVDGRKFSVFEIDILTEKGRFIFSRHGLYLDFYNLRDSIYDSYKELDRIRAAELKTKLESALNDYVENVVQFLNGKEELICTVDDAIAVHKIYKNLKEGI